MALVNLSGNMIILKKDSSKMVSDREKGKVKSIMMAAGKLGAKHGFDKITHPKENPKLYIY